MGNTKGISPESLTVLEGVKHLRVDGRTNGRARLVRLFYEEDVYDVTSDMIEIQVEEKKSDDSKFTVE